VQGARVLERPSAASSLSAKKYDFSLQDRSGVAFILNVTDRLPLTTCSRSCRSAGAPNELRTHPLAPLNPLRQLQGNVHWAAVSIAVQPVKRTNPAEDPDARLTDTQVASFCPRLRSAMIVELTAAER